MWYNIWLRIGKENITEGVQGGWLIYCLNTTIYEKFDENII